MAEVTTNLILGPWGPMPGTDPFTTFPTTGGLTSDECGLFDDLDNDGKPDTPSGQAFAISTIDISALPECALSDPNLKFKMSFRSKGDHPSAQADRTTINISTTRGLTVTELAHVQAIVDSFPPGPGEFTIVAGPDQDPSFSGGSVAFVSDGTAPREQLLRALNLPTIPPCATGVVTLDVSIDLMIANTTGNPVGSVVVLDRTSPIPVAYTETSPPGNGSWTLAIAGQALDLAKYLNGDYYVAINMAEPRHQRTADFEWSNAAASVSYDATACASVTQAAYIGAIDSLFVDLLPITATSSNAVLWLHGGVTARGGTDDGLWWGENGPPEYVTVSAEFLPSAQLLADNALTIIMLSEESVFCYGGVEVVAVYDDTNCAPVEPPVDEGETPFDWVGYLTEGLPDCPSVIRTFCAGIIPDLVNSMFAGVESPYDESYQYALLKKDITLGDVLCKILEVAVKAFECCKALELRVLTLEGALATLTERVASLEAAAIVQSSVASGIVETKK